jgi:hypothetical protein
MRCLFLLLLAAAELSADTIDISSLFLATVGQGNTVQINFGIADYASQAIAAGFSPYPTGLDLSIVTLLPPGSSDLSRFIVSAQLTSNDDSISIPISPSPITLAAGTLGSNGGPTVPVGIFFGSLDFSPGVSQALFTPADFVIGNTSAARIIVTNLGADFTIGVSGYYANTFPIGGCCIVEAPGIRGDAPFSTGGDTGTVLLTTPEPPGLVSTMGALLLLGCLRRPLRPGRRTSESR